MSKELGARLKALTAAKKLRQSELAVRIGMDYEHLNRVLNGRRPIYAEDVPRFAKALGVSLEEILGPEEA